jgi:hypothetical protein
MCALRCIIQCLDILFLFVFLHLLRPRTNKQRLAYRSLSSYALLRVMQIIFDTIRHTAILSQRGHWNNGILSLAGNLYSP